MSWIADTYAAATVLLGAYEDAAENDIDLDIENDGRPEGEQ